MNSLKNVVASVLRFVGVALILLGCVLFVLGYAAQQQNEDGMMQWILGGLSFLVGMLVTVFSSPVARALTQDYE